VPTIRHLALSWRWNCSDSQNCGFLSPYVIGVSCTYDVFDQQFANFFTSFFLPVNRVRVFGYVTTMGELLNASIMFFAPLIINRIGGKNASCWLALLCQYVLLAHRSLPQHWKWLF
jgi:OHS family lactose permease-like MFS transporter